MILGIGCLDLFIRTNMKPNAKFRKECAEYFKVINDFIDCPSCGDNHIARTLNHGAYIYSTKFQCVKCRHMFEKSLYKGIKLISLSVAARPQLVWNGDMWVNDEH